MIHTARTHAPRRTGPSSRRPRQPPTARRRCRRRRAGRTPHGGASRPPPARPAGGRAPFVAAPPPRVAAPGRGRAAGRRPRPRRRHSRRRTFTNNIHACMYIICMYGLYTCIHVHISCRMRGKQTPTRCIFTGRGQEKGRFDLVRVNHRRFDSAASFHSMVHFLVRRGDRG